MFQNGNIKLVKNIEKNNWYAIMRKMINKKINHFLICKGRKKLWKGRKNGNKNYSIN